MKQPTWTTRQVVIAIAATAVVSFCAGFAFAHSPAQAVAVALSDRGIGPHVRYVWIPDATEAAGQYVTFAANAAISRARTLVPIARIANGMLMRLDLRMLAPNDGDYVDVASTWERLADTEPYFLVNTFAERQITVPKYQASDGKWYTHKIVKARSFGPHCGTDAAQLFAATGSAAPIVRADWFLRTILSTLDGGLYYEFRGIKKSTVKGKTDEQAFLESHGASQETTERLRADQKIAILRGDVTGKSRVVLFIRSLATRLGDNQGAIFITLDTQDGDFDPAADPIRNILNFKVRGKEVLAEMPNGLIIYVLFDGNGALARSVPDNIAKDHTIPSPHTGRLEPGLSCIVCHSLNKGDDGYKPLRNDVATLLRRGLAVVGGPDEIDRVAGLYLGDFDKPIRRARDDHSDAITRITGGKATVQQLSQGLGTYVRSYKLDLVTTAKACAELGVPVKEAEAVNTFNQLLPPALDGTPIIDDPIIAALKAGIGVNRSQFEVVYAGAATRATATLAAKMKQVLDPE